MVEEILSLIRDEWLLWSSAFLMGCSWLGFMLSGYMPWVG